MDKKPYETILIDQDGVLAAFATFNRIITNEWMRETHGVGAIQISQEYLIENARYDMEKHWELTQESWWGIICASKNFWVNIPMFPWVPQLLDRLRMFCNELIVSTNPGTEDLSSPSQKSRWLHNRRSLLHVQPDDIMIGAKKYLLANPKTLLIDDSLRNVDSFINSGGSAVCVPSDWNSKTHGLAEVWDAITKDTKILV